jgi:hypothetical protein
MRRRHWPVGISRPSLWQIATPSILALALLRLSLNLSLDKEEHLDDTYIAFLRNYFNNLYLLLNGIFMQELNIHEVEEVNGGEAGKWRRSWCAA